MPPKARWIELQNNAKQPTIGKLIDDAMDQIERENPSLKGILPKTYARPDLDKTRLGELIDLIGTLTLKSATPFFFCRGLDEVHKSVNLESMKRITFYTTASGRCPVQEHFDTLPDKTVQKIAWVLRVVRDLEHVPSQYLKKLVNTNDIWEVRVDVGRNTFRCWVSSAGAS